MPTSRLEVDLRAVDRNLEVVRSVLAPGTSGASAPGVCAILKQDGYGMGAVRLAKRLAAGPGANASGAGPAVGVEMIGVYSLDEARAIYEAVARVPLLVLMPVGTMDRHDPLYRAAGEGRLHLVLHDHEQLDGLVELTGRLGVSLPVHVQLDTGLSRGGVDPEGARSLIERVVTSQRLLLNGVMTHFASPCADEAFTTEQAGRFEEFMDDVSPLLRAALLNGHNPARPARDSFIGTGGLAELSLHMANTCATFRSRRYHGTMVRVGQCLLGFALDEAIRLRSRMGERADIGEFEFEAHAQRLAPAARWTSYTAHVQEIGAGWPVGYGSTWRAPKRPDGRPTRIAVVPVGYADGYPRALSSAADRRLVAGGASGAWVGFTGRPWERRGAGTADPEDGDGGVVDAGDRASGTVFAPVVGRVSMDQITVDVTDVPEAMLRSASAAGSSSVAMEVEIYGRDPRAPNYMPTLAAAAGSITHELLCRVGPRVERAYRYPAPSAGGSIPAGGVASSQGVLPQGWGSAAGGEPGLIGGEVSKSQIRPAPHPAERQGAAEMVTRARLDSLRTRIG